jgi:hypothetical protein
MALSRIVTSEKTVETRRLRWAAVHDIPLVDQRVDDARLLLRR